MVTAVIVWGVLGVPVVLPVHQFCLSSVTVIVAKAFHPLFFLQAPNLLVHWCRLLVPGAVGHDYMANITGFETTARDRECVSNRDYCCASPRLLYYLLCICWEHCS